jgi:ubiquinone/menaquinone biosynthesis C-methylase UbiE
MMGERSIIQERFERQARAFARSPLQRDPERLRQLIAFSEARPSDRILDVACGPGIVTGEMARRGLFAVGVDVTEAMLREADRAREGRYVVGDATCLPFHDEAFDLVTCRNSFHHFSDPLSVARQMKRTVRPGGAVVVEDMRAPDDPARREYHESVERLRDPAHVHTLTRAELHSILGGAGLVVDQEHPLQLVIDVEEWLDRAFPTPGNKERVHAMIEACLTVDRCGIEVWRETRHLKFRRRSHMVRALRPS